MPHIQVRDVPADIHQALLRAAESNGQSLQRFLSAELALLVSRRPADETREQIEAQAEGHRLGLEPAFESVRADRLDEGRAATLTRLQALTQLSATEIVGRGIDLVAEEQAKRHRQSPDAILSSAFVGCLHNAPEDLAANYRTYLAEAVQAEPDAG